MIKYTPEFYDIIIKIATMLLPEQRLRAEVEASDRLGSPITLELTTINREHGRLTGQGGTTIRSLDVMCKALEIASNVVLIEPADDTIQPNHPRESCTMLELITEYVEACSQHMPNGVVDTIPGGYRIITTKAVMVELRVACERVFFACGRVHRERASIEWEVLT